MNNLRLQNLDILDDLDLLIIDQNPNSKHGEETAKFARVAGIRYIPYTEKISTASRNKIFDYAEAPFALCIDCHVLFEPNTIKKLIDFYDRRPDTNDLYQGPLFWDQFHESIYYMRPEWWDHNYGAWGGNSKKITEDDDPFEIPMQGLGLFSCRTDAWLRFNDHFTGFGGEEGYIHQKYKKAGYKTWCIPFLRWNHRFPRPDGVPYPLTLGNKIRNYLITQKELGLPLEPIIEHFKKQVDTYDSSKDLEYVKSLDIPVFFTRKRNSSFKRYKNLAYSSFG